MVFWQEQKQMSERLIQVQETMEQVAPTKGRFTKILKDLLANQGKMLRPALLILVAGFENEEKEPLHLAAALEFLHMASLVHDDIIDHSDSRRGVPSVVKEHGTAMAIYTGDYLIYQAARSIAPIERTLFEGQSLDFMAALLEAEAAQLEDRFVIGLSGDEYLKRIESKTGLLFSLAASIGYGLNGQSQQTMSQVKKAGLQFGVAFQLRDDLLDFEDPEFGDLKEGNLTLPVLLGLKQDPSLQGLLDLLAQKWTNVLDKNLVEEREENQVKEDRQRQKGSHHQLAEDELIHNEPVELQDLCLTITQRVRKTSALKETKWTLQRHLDQATAVFRTIMEAEEFLVYLWMINELFGVQP